MEAEQKIMLSLENDMQVADISEYSTDGYSVPSDLGIPFSEMPQIMEPASLTVNGDFDSSYRPSTWIWLQFFTDEEPWFRLTYAEAAQLRDFLNGELKFYDKLSDEEKSEVNYTE